MDAVAGIAVAGIRRLTQALQQRPFVIASEAKQTIVSKEYWIAHMGNV